MALLGHGNEQGRGAIAVLAVERGAAAGQDVSHLRDEGEGGINTYAVCVCVRVTCEI